LFLETTTVIENNRETHKSQINS